MKYEIKNRWTGAVQFTAEIECEADASERIKLGLAVRAAVSAGADLRGADLRGADLLCVDLRGANLRGADLRGADLLCVDLRGANLARTNLAGTDLAGANLEDANLAGAYLVGTKLAHANLTDTNLVDACLVGANLAGANLVRTNLAGAYLAGANLADTNLAGANLAGANIRDGITITQAPISVHGLAWDVVIYDQHMQIGCEFHSHDEWRGFSREDWLRMGGKEAIRLLERHFPALDFLCAVHAKADQTDAAESGATAS